MRASGFRACAIVLLYLAGARSGAGAAAQDSWGLPQLMAALAQVKSASAQFTERKTLRILTEPLTLSGRLAYVAPSHIEKITLSPTPEKLVMDGDRVTIVAGPNNETQTFSVAEYPQIGGLVEGIRATLAGDLPTLNRFYAMRLSGTATAWDLHLVPKNADLTRFVKSIEFRGSGGRIQTIFTEDSDGDHSEMTIVEYGCDAR